MSCQVVPRILLIILIKDHLNGRYHKKCYFWGHYNESDGNRFVHIRENRSTRVRPTTQKPAWNVLQLMLWAVVFSRPFILIATPFFDFVDFECIFYQLSSSSYSLPSERATPSKPNTTNRFNSKTYFSDCSKFYHTHIDTLSWPDTKRLWSADIERLPVVVFCSIICLTPL